MLGTCVTCYVYIYRERERERSLYTSSHSKMHTPTITSGGYISCSETFLITDTLDVEPPSNIADDLEEKKIFIGKKELT